MPTSYPTGIDNFADPTASDTLDGEVGGAPVYHDVQHSDVNDAIKAIETTIGTTGAFNFGGGGYPNSVVVRKFAVAYNTPNLLTGATLYTPNAGDVILDWWIEIDTAWNGLTPYLDLSTFESAGQGLLGRIGANPIALWTTWDAVLLYYTGIYATEQPTSWSASLMSAAITNGAPVAMSQVRMYAGTTPLKIVISQDGTSSTAAPATLDATSTFSSLTISGSNNQFIYNGATPTGGGGSRIGETFTIASGSYGSIGTMITGLLGAQGSFGSEPFSNYCTAANDGSGKIQLSANGSTINAGAAGNGNYLTSASNDALVPMGFSAPEIFEGGAGGNPGASQGSGTVFLVTATPS